MAYHVYRLAVDILEEGSNYLLRHLLDLDLIIGFEKEPVLEHGTGVATFYVKVPNKRKFEAYFNRKWHENADPVSFAAGKPTYDSYRSDGKKDVGTKVREFINKSKAKKINSK